MLLSLRKHYDSSEKPDDFSYWFKKIPALGFPPQITVTFKNNCRNSYKCSALVSTCSLRLDIRTHIRDEETILEVFERGLEEDVGFGRC